MKRRTAIITIDIDDNFQVGECSECPLSFYDEYFNSICPFGWYYDKCYMEIKEDDK